MDIAKILKGKYPARKWALNGDSYDGLIMLDGSPKPSETELESHWAEVQAIELRTEIVNAVQNHMEIGRAHV